MAFLRIAAACASLSLLCPDATAETQRGIVYARPDGARLLLDARIPNGMGPFPAVVIVHGGAWIGGTRGFDVSPLFRPLADAGFATFSISYRLARKPLSGSVIDSARIVDAIDDVQAAVAFVRGRAKEFNIDPSRIALLGESAGAQLAAMAAIRGHDATAVNTVVVIACPSDLTALSQGPKFVPGPFRNALARFTWGSSTHSNMRDLSPIANIRPEMPPFLFIHGTADLVVPFAQSVAMCDEMRESGAKCQVYPVKGGIHGIRFWEALHKTAYKQAIVDWLTSPRL